MRLINMKTRVLLICLFTLLASSCTPIKRMQTGLARKIVGSDTIAVSGHEVYCSDGRVCTEVEVKSISIEDRDYGRVRVLLKNRTGNTALIQIRLQVKDSSTHEIITETRAENVAIKATEEKSYIMPGIARKEAKVRVLLNSAY